MAAAATDVPYDLPYLSRNELFTHQKPYSSVLDVSSIPGASPSNHVVGFFPKVIRDARASGSRFTLHTNGFEFLKETTNINPQNASDTGFVTGEYIPRLLEILKRNFPEYESFRVIDFQVRKRSEKFPAMLGAPTEFAQPAALPHCDFSTKGSFIRISEVLPEEDYAGKEFDMLNVWQVLAGPNNDWPLALCDSASIDHVNDTIPNDVLHPHTIGENLLLFHNEKHEWHYLSGQEGDDLVVFRNSNSKTARATSFHAAFDTGIPGLPPRQSIETRFAAFW